MKSILSKKNLELKSNTALNGWILLNVGMMPNILHYLIKVSTLLNIVRRIHPMSCSFGESFQNLLDTDVVPPAI